MKFYCPECKTTFYRDIRLKVEKLFMTKRGYKSHCDKTNNLHYCKRVK